VKTLIRLLRTSFILSLRLYPRSFRHEFDEEMAAVFNATLEDASKGGAPGLLACALREIRDGPSRVLRERFEAINTSIQSLGNQFPEYLHLRRRPGEKLIMSEDAPVSKNLGLDRRLVVLAVLPPLLFGLGVALDSLIRGGPWNTIPIWRLYLSVGVGLFPMLIIAAVGLYGLMKRMPDWSLTWIGAGYMGFVLLVKTASEELADVGRFMVSQTVDFILVLAILIAGAVILGFSAIKGWRRAALFSIGMSAVFCLSLYLSVTSAPFYRHDLALIAAPVGLVLSLLTYGFLAGPDRFRALVLLGVGLINLSPILVTNQVWNDWLLNDGRPSLSLPLLVLLTAVLVSGPAMGIILNPVRKFFDPPKS
jgi:hypothetical protein